MSLARAIDPTAGPSRLVCEVPTCRCAEAPRPVRVRRPGWSAPESRWLCRRHHAEAHAEGLTQDPPPPVRPTLVPATAEEELAMPRSPWTCCRYPGCDVEYGLRHGVCGTHMQRLTKLGHKSAEIGTWTDAQIAEAAAAWDQRPTRPRKASQPKAAAQPTRVTGIPMADDDSPPAQPAPSAAAIEALGVDLPPQLGGERPKVPQLASFTELVLRAARRKLDVLPAGMGTEEALALAGVQALAASQDGAVQQRDAYAAQEAEILRTIAEVEPPPDDDAPTAWRVAAVVHRLQEAHRDLIEATSRATARENELLAELDQARKQLGDERARMGAQNERDREAHRKAMADQVLTLRNRLEMDCFLRGEAAAHFVRPNASRVRGLVRSAVQCTPDAAGALAEALLTDRS